MKSKNQPESDWSNARLRTWLHQWKLSPPTSVVKSQALRAAMTAFREAKHDKNHKGRYAD